MLSCSPHSPTSNGMRMTTRSTKQNKLSHFKFLSLGTCHNQTANIIIMIIINSSFYLATIFHIWPCHPFPLTTLWKMKSKMRTLLIDGMLWVVILLVLVGCPAPAQSSHKVIFQADFVVLLSKPRGRQQDGGKIWHLNHLSTNPLSSLANLFCNNQFNYYCIPNKKHFLVHIMQQQTNCFSRTPGLRHSTLFSAWHSAHSINVLVCLVFLMWRQLLPPVIGASVPSGSHKEGTVHTNLISDGWLWSKSCCRCHCGHGGGVSVPVFEWIACDV